MSKILGISGKKGAGKNTIANTIVGLYMKSLGITDAFQITKQGELWINGVDEDKRARGVIDLSSRFINENIDNFCKQRLDNYIKLYSLADLLKQGVCIDILGLSYKQCYGDDECKNTETHLRWEDMPGISGGFTGPMTARQVLQYVGTDIFRKMYDNVWVNACINQIREEQPDMAIITDVRFINEVQGIKDANGKVIRLTRSPNLDSHTSETELDPDNFDWNNFDFVIDNENLSLTKQFEPIYKALFPLGWLPLEVLNIEKKK